jgi:hypothetical protein
MATHLEVKLWVDGEIRGEEARGNSNGHEWKAQCAHDEDEVSVLLGLPPKPVLHCRDGEEEEETKEELIHALIAPREGETEDDKDLDDELSDSLVPQRLTLDERSAVRLQPRVWG